MSTTVQNQKSKTKIDNPCPNCGQTISDENGKITMPPTASKSCLSIIEVKEGPEGILEARNSVLTRDGKLISKEDEKVVADFGEKAFDTIEKYIKERTKTKENGMDR